LVEAPLHNTGPGFYSFCPHFVALGSAQALTEISVPRNFLGGDIRPEHKADNSAVLFVPKDGSRKSPPPFRVCMTRYGKTVLDKIITEM